MLRSAWGGDYISHRAPPRRGTALHAGKCSLHLGRRAAQLHPTGWLLCWSGVTSINSWRRGVGHAPLFLLARTRAVGGRIWGKLSAPFERPLGAGFDWWRGGLAPASERATGSGCSQSSAGRADRRPVRLIRFHGSRTARFLPPPPSASLPGLLCFTRRGQGSLSWRPLAGLQPPPHHGAAGTRVSQNPGPFCCPWDPPLPPLFFPDWGALPRSPLTKSPSGPWRASSSPVFPSWPEAKPKGAPPLPPLPAILGLKGSFSSIPRQKQGLGELFLLPPFQSKDSSRCSSVPHATPPNYLHRPETFSSTHPQI